jgi:cysteine sulfinate desulfinase/cysteine desulfurase-like protein
MDREQAKCAIRLSVGPDTTSEEIDFAVERLLGAFESLRR